MDHVVSLSQRANELEKLVTGEQTMLVRGTFSRQPPFGQVGVGDCLYLVELHNAGLIRARTWVKSVSEHEQLSPNQARRVLALNQNRLRLDPAQIERFAEQPFLLLVEIRDLEVVVPFRIDLQKLAGSSDWQILESIEQVR